MTLTSKTLRVTQRALQITLMKQGMPSRLRLRSREYGGWGGHRCIIGLRYGIHGFDGLVGSAALDIGYAVVGSW